MSVNVGTYNESERVGLSYQITFDVFPNVPFTGAEELNPARVNGIQYCKPLGSSIKVAGDELPAPPLYTSKLFASNGVLKSGKVNVPSGAGG